MSAVHEHSLKISSSPTHVQLACDGVYLALPQARKSIGIWSLQDITCKPVDLEGHSKNISALTFGNKFHPTLLCSGAEDYVIVWNVEKARAAVDAGQQVRGRVIGTTLGRVQYLAFSPNDLLVAVCVDREVYILDSTQERVDTVLEGHLARVNCAEFCPHYTSTLVTASDDRTFKIWNISESSLLYQSTIISSSPFISLTMNPFHENFATGTADGQVRVYDLTDGNGFRCLQHLDVEKMINKVKDVQTRKVDQIDTQNGPKTISSRPSWHKPGLADTAIEEVMETEDSEAGCAILGMKYATRLSDDSRAPTPAKLSFLQHSSSVVSELLQNPPILAIGTTGAMLLVNAKTLEPAACMNLQEPVPSNSIMEESRTVSLAGNVILAQSVTSQEKLWCILGGLFQNEVHILQMLLPSQHEIDSLGKSLSKSSSLSSSTAACLGASPETSAEEQSLTGCDNKETVTVLSSNPLLPNSPLKAELIMKKSSSQTAKKQIKVSAIPPSPTQYGALSRRGTIAGDQSVTVHSKIKSSGYSVESPVQAMFQPKTNASKQGRGSAKTNPQGALPVRKEYPLDAGAPTQLLVKLDAAERPTAINKVRFSEDGQNLACALGNNSAQVFKMPLTGKGWAFASHTGIVTNVHWSHHSKWLITSSEDRTARVWALGLSDPIMTFSMENNNFGADKEGGIIPSKENQLFRSGVKFAQFYYMDKFILLTCGNSFNLYKYHLDLSKSDIKRYLTNNRYKIVKSFQMSEAQQITSFSALNGFYSYIALCAGSNKSIEVFDLNVGQGIRMLPNAHSRTIHAVCQNQGSPYVSHPNSAYDLFVTAASSDCIKLWDLRTNRCVRRYEGHCNRTQPCGLTISPCSKFIATGSEDRCAYIFDIRTGTYLHKLTGHTDTISDVAFHPFYPQLVTASLDGKLKLFT